MKNLIKSSKDKKYVFCYGTLKKYNRNFYMMDGATYIGKGRLHGVTMVDLGRYPGLISGDNSVVGEIYCVSDNIQIHTNFLFDIKLCMDQIFLRYKFVCLWIYNKIPQIDLFLLHQRYY